MNDIKELIDEVYLNFQKGYDGVIPDEYKDEYNEFIKGRLEEVGVSSNASNRRVFMRAKMIDSPKGQLLKSKLYDMYHIKEYGYKTIAKRTGIGYTVCRTIFDILDIPVRTGYDVVTNRVRRLRGEKSQREHDNQTGWWGPDIRRKTTGFKKGIQGYFWNPSMNKYCWLRSTYEFIYASWLVRTNANWDNEVKRYKLKSGTLYLPDFFIYNDDWKLQNIVEIKGYAYVRENKHELLNEMLDGIDVSIVSGKEVFGFIESNSNYNTEKEKWLNTRLSVDELKK